MVWLRRTIPFGTSAAYGRPSFKRCSPASKFTPELITASAAFTASCTVRADQNCANAAATVRSAAAGRTEVSAMRTQAADATRTDIRFIVPPPLNRLDRHKRVVIRLHRVGIDRGRGQQH